MIMVLKAKIGFIPCHRYPFDEKWAVAIRRRTIKALRKIEGLQLVAPSAQVTPGGIVSGYADVEPVKRLFREKQVDGVLIGCMTFGDENSAVAVAESVKHDAALMYKPVLVFPTKEPPFAKDGGRSSDAFCGGLSITSQLVTKQIAFEALPPVLPEEEEFVGAVGNFARACVAVQRFVGARVGRVGTHPDNFFTCAVDEREMFRRYGQRVLSLDTAQLYHDALALPSHNRKVRRIVEEIERSADCSAVGEDVLLRVAKYEIVLEKWIDANHVDVVGVQCWPHVEPLYGIAPCTAMSRLTSRGKLAACEVDLNGALTMGLQHGVALGRIPPHFVDWTTNHPKDPNKLLAWHCGNAPHELCAPGRKVRINTQFIMAKALGDEVATGCSWLQLGPGPVTLARLVEVAGDYRFLIARGELSREALKTHGSGGWVKVPDLRALYEELQQGGFVHHCSLIHGDHVDALIMAANFLGFDTTVL
jgi:L-fucose isomerase-like protein